jgi:hypothetical protein
MNVNGPATLSPSFVPLRKYSTFVTLPPGSAAFTVTVKFVGASNVALFAGLVMDTVGGVFATPVTVTFATADVADNPASSVATARS